MGRVVPSPANVMQTALVHHRAGRLRDAEKLYRRILKRHPKDADALHLLGLVEHQSGRQDAAKKLVDRALRQSPMTPAYLNTLGQVHSARGDLDAALEALTRAVSRQTDYVEAYHNLGNLHRARGDSDASKSAFLRALSYRPRHAESLNGLGALLRELGDVEGAVASIQRALESNPELADAHHNLALLYAQLDRHGPALSHFRRAMTLDPDPGRFLAAFVVELRRVQFNRWDDWYADLLTRLLTNPDLEHRSLIPATLSMLEHHRDVARALSSEDPDVSALAGHHLLAIVLRSGVVTDVGFERLVARLRAKLCSSPPDPEALELFAAVAEQCFNTEYAHWDTPPAPPIPGDVAGLALEWTVLAAASHGVLAAHADADRLAAIELERWSEPVRRVVRRTLVEPRTEAVLRERIRTVTPIRDRVSNAVRAQYEEHPYPRWLNVPRLPPQSLATSLACECPGSCSTFRSGRAPCSPAWEPAGILSASR